MYVLTTNKHGGGWCSLFALLNGSLNVFFSSRSGLLTPSELAVSLHPSLEQASDHLIYLYPQMRTTQHAMLDSARSLACSWSCSSLLCPES